ncbi:hypothetical protein [Metabacillus fastidiosus]|uniref:hypothetical protein n=1 Tax=Metabacillus fastidiosus TaxID=1458 RepID=UPI003D2DD414
MPRQRIYYDYVNEELVPYWYVITFKHHQIDWDQSTLYFQVTAPFEYFDRDNFDDSILSLSILMSDIVIHKNDPSKIGIHLKRIKETLLNHGADPSLCRQFIIQIPDIQDILHLLPNKRNFFLSKKTNEVLYND